ncbi:MAG: hypothetical protein QM520_00900 [Gammaproteobacteria bacterium]|nr:hypothetical protein [Gammaproteobacteria bacterium]
MIIQVNSAGGVRASLVMMTAHRAAPADGATVFSLLRDKTKKIPLLEFNEVGSLPSLTEM